MKSPLKISLRKQAPISEMAIPYMTNKKSKFTYMKLFNKYGLIIFKKLAFQLFYFGFITLFVFFFDENRLRFSSNFILNPISIEIFLICILLFYVNSIFFAKEMVVHKKYFSFSSLFTEYTWQVKKR